MASEELTFNLLMNLGQSPPVRVGRRKYLEAAFKGREGLDAILEKGPLAAGIPLEEIDRLAWNMVRLEAGRSAGLSFLTGLPGGGLGLAAGLTADVVQYYGVGLIILQKMLYLYNYDQDVFSEGLEQEEGRLELFTACALAMFADELSLRIAADAAHKGVPELTPEAARETAWKGANKKAVSQINDKLSAKGIPNFVKGKLVRKATGEMAEKLSARIAGKLVRVVPVIGGVVSGALTLNSMVPAGRRLRKYVRTTYLETTGGPEKMKQRDGSDASFLENDTAGRF